MNTDNSKNGSLQAKTVAMVLIIVIVIIATFLGVSAYQNRTLTRIVGETRVEQQNAIAQTSGEVMNEMISSIMIDETALQAKIANNDFAEIINNTYMLQTIAQSLMDNRDLLTPATVGLPDVSTEGTMTAMVLKEDGVDHTQSEYLKILGHMSGTLVALADNSDKIESCYIGICDGTHISANADPAIRYDEDGNLISYSARNRPWYKAAEQAGKLVFTGIEKDAFSGVPYITCTAPIFEDGKVVVVVGIDVILDSMNDFIMTSSTSDGFAFIVNEKGLVVLAPDKIDVFGAQINADLLSLRTVDNKGVADVIKKALKEETDITVVSINDKEYYMVGAPMPSVGWAVIAIVDKEVTEQPEKIMLTEYDKINDYATGEFRRSSRIINQTSGLIISALFALSIIGAFLASRKIAKPLQEMTNDIREGSGTDKIFEMKDIYKTGDEIQVLAEAFDDLSQKNKQYIDDITQITKEKERVNTELDMANQIQTTILPHIFPAFPNRNEFDVYATMNPAKEVGGDFYDFYIVDDNHLAIAIADVSGKGVPAALFMMVTKAILKNNAMLNKSVGEVLAMTNDMLCSNNQLDMFVTVWMGILEISTGILTCANAGHEYPVIMRDGRFELLKDSHGFVLGGFENETYDEYQIRLEKGDKLFVYTDGVPEAVDAERTFFGTDRLVDSLNKVPDADPEQILDNVKSDVDTFVKGAEQFDDITMLCLEYKGPEIKD